MGKFSLVLFAVLVVLGVSSPAQADPRWSVFGGAGVSLVSYGSHGGVTTIADRVTIAQQLSLTRRLGAHWSLRFSVLLGETPIVSTVSAAMSCWGAYQQGIFFVGAGPLGGYWATGWNAGVFLSTGVAVPVSTRLTWAIGFQVPILLVGSTSISAVVGSGIAVRF